jgi:N-hydroxyarylamine O-acetyltransferase
MTDHLDLDSYFARIGYDGPREPTLAVLAALHDRHPRAIPFENLDPLLGRTPRLDLASLQAKLVAGRRGGYCFEHNGLLLAVLRALGFEVTPLAARVQWMAPPERLAPRTHMLLRVDLPEGPFLADVGFGGLTKTAPLRLVPDLEQPAGPIAFRLAPLAAGELQLQVRLPEGWAPMYRFTPDPQQPVDYELASWFVATHPTSPFVNGLMVAFVGEDRRYALAGLDLTVRHDDGRVERRTLDAAGLEALMHDTLGLARPEGVGALYRRLADVASDPRRAGE